MVLSKVGAWLVEKTRFPLLIGSLIGGPALTYAQRQPEVSGIETCDKLLQLINNIARFGGGVVLVVAIIVFLIAGYYFLFGAGSEDAAKKGRQFLVFGVVGIIVVLAAFSLPFLVRSVTGLTLPACQ